MLYFVQQLFYHHYIYFFKYYMFFITTAKLFKIKLIEKQKYGYKWLKSDNIVSLDQCVSGETIESVTCNYTATICCIKMYLIGSSIELRNESSSPPSAPPVPSPGKGGWLVNRAIYPFTVKPIKCPKNC